MMNDFGNWQENKRDKLAGVNYIIDGHNLIAHIPGLSLSMPDDEEQLVALLNKYCEHSRSKAEVYFDGAPPGQAGVRRYRQVRAHFTRKSSTADEAIMDRLSQMGKGKSLHDWIVVSSDRSIQAAAHEAHAGVMKSEEFGLLLQDSLQSSTGDTESRPDPPLSPAEVDEWLAIFKGRKSTK